MKTEPRFGVLAKISHMNISFLPLQTHSPPCTPLQPPPQDLIYMFAPIPAASQKRPLRPLQPLSSGDPRPFPCAFPKALFAAGNGRALQPKSSVTDVGFVTLTSLQGIPLPPSSSSIFSLHAITVNVMNYLQGRSGSHWVLHISQLGALSFNFSPTKQLVGTDKEQGEGIG